MTFFLVVGLIFCAIGWLISKVRIKLMEIKMDKYRETMDSIKATVENNDNPPEVKIAILKSLFMTGTEKKPLSWYEDNAAEVKINNDGSVTYIFDEPMWPGDRERSTNRTTVKKEDYEAATKDSKLLI